MTVDKEIKNSIDVINYLAIDCLESIGIFCPSEKEINIVEGYLRQCDAMENSATG